MFHPIRQKQYRYIFIDYGWQCGRDNRCRMIPDPKKFSSGIKALATPIKIPVAFSMAFHSLL